MRRTARIALAVAGSIVLSTGCASTRGGSAPGWVAGESARYPRETYLTGVGFGDSRATAEDRAYAAISRIFEAEVNQRTHEWERYLQTEAGRETTIRRSVGIEQLTAVRKRDADRQRAPVGGRNERRVLDVLRPDADDDLTAGVVRQAGPPGVQ